MSKYNTDLDYAIPLIDISEEELNEIIAEADKIISENSESPKELAVAYLKKSQCLQKLEQCIILESEPETVYSFTIFFEDKQKQSEIKGLLEKALELSPQMPEALMRLGTTYGKIATDKGNIDKALDLTTRAIQLKPDYAAAFNNRSDVILKSNTEDNIKKAIADLSEAISIRPFEALYYYNRAGRYSDLAMHEKAIEDLTNAINCGSDAFKKTIHIFLERGKKYMELKEYRKAIDDFSESLNLETDLVNILLMRAKAWYLADEKDKAKADIEEYLKRKRKLTYDAGREEIFKQIGIMPEEILKENNNGIILDIDSEESRKKFEKWYLNSITP